MKVARSYINYSYDLTKAYKNNSGKLVVDASCKCDRCVKGIFPSRVENDQIVPHPNANGICFKCNGTGCIKKTIRLYTDEEYERIEKRNKKEKERKQAKLEEKMLAEAAEKKTKWLKKHGCNDSSTFIYFPLDSYEKREKLKLAGFSFDPVLLWHCATPPAEFLPFVIELPLNDFVDFTKWGTGFIRENTEKMVKDLMKKARPKNPSSYVGEIGKKIIDHAVVLVSIRPFESAYGASQIVKFLDSNGNILKWFTSTNIDFDINTSLLLSGTVKKQERDKYEDDAEVTILTRCKLKEV